ncbi:MAG: glycoside hydrolase family 25 protein, partial [Ferruginibacter sp.]
MARRKKRSSSKYFFKIIFWLALACFTVYYAVNYFVASSDVFYPDFQIAIPRGYEIHGIDVSKYQNVI